jgi:heterodisulfide reductase subunit C
MESSRVSTLEKGDRIVEPMKTDKEKSDSPSSEPGLLPPVVQEVNRRVIGDRGNYFLRRMEGETGVPVAACYQCERCTNACPVALFMDIKPHQVIRHVQLGWREPLVNSATIWACLSCEMCTTYCPNVVGVAEVISHLRNMAAHSAIPPKERHLAVFHKTFLEQLKRFGRINEFWLMNAFNLKPGILKDKIRSGCLKEEILLGWARARKGKLHLMPKKCKGIQEIQDLYRQE